MALQDLQDGVDYYNSRQKALGKKFAEETAKAIDRIGDMPQAASIAYEDVRYKTIDKFPYIVTYNFDDNFVNIFRVFNTYLNPEKM